MKLESGFAPPKPLQQLPTPHNGPAYPHPYTPQMGQPPFHPPYNYPPVYEQYSSAMQTPRHYQCPPPMKAEIRQDDKLDDKENV